LSRLFRCERPLAKRQCKPLPHIHERLGKPVNQGDFRWRSASYVILPWVDALVRHPKILDVVEDLIGPDILVYTATWFIKEARSPTFAAWHQDATYFALDPVCHVTAWVAAMQSPERVAAEQARRRRDVGPVGQPVGQLDVEEPGLLGEHPIDERLSGTGPKAGGPRYLHRFATERTVSVDTTAAGGNATLLSLSEDG